MLYMTVFCFINVIWLLIFFSSHLPTEPDATNDDSLSSQPSEASHHATIADISDSERYVLKFVLQLYLTCSSSYCFPLHM
jgi:hypothetical protein